MRADRAVNYMLYFLRDYHPENIKLLDKCHVRNLYDHDAVRPSAIAEFEEQLKFVLFPLGEI